MTCKKTTKRIKSVNPVRNSSGALNPALRGGTPYGAEPGIILKCNPHPPCSRRPRLRPRGASAPEGGPLARREQRSIISNGVNQLHHGKTRSLLNGIPKDLPSLSRAERITRRVSSAGFDWPDLTGVLTKMDEEMKELGEALSSGDRRKIREEIGDLLFVLVNLARFLRIDPEEALRRTIEKFISRFHYIETSLHQKGRSVYQSNLSEMDCLWEEAKVKSPNPKHQ